LFELKQLECASSNTELRMRVWCVCVCVRERERERERVVIPEKIGARETESSNT
jgi:hypothetical protein